MRVYLIRNDSAQATDKVTVQIMTDYKNSESVLASASYVFGDSPNGWQTILFPESVTLSPGVLYYLRVFADEGSNYVAWNGFGKSNSFDTADFHALNYDNGWKTTENVTSFEILPSNEEDALPSVYSQQNAGTALYKINAPSNRAIQPFAVPFTKICAVRAYLSCVNDTDQVQVRILDNFKEDANVVAQEVFTIRSESEKKGWKQLDFAQPPELEAGKRYYLEFSAPEDCGNVVLYGGAAVHGYASINYDKNDGGYKLDNKTSAFEVVEDSTDRDAAQAVISMIAALPSPITAESGPAIEAAEKAHAALSSTRKNLVSNYSLLVAAREAYDRLCRPADYTAVDAALEKAAALVEADYTAASWAKLQAAVNAVVRDLTAAEQATVDGYAAAIEAAISALVPKTVEMELTISTGMVTAAAAEGKYDITWNARILLGGELSVDDINAAGVQFKNYGVYYGTGKDVLNDYKNATADQIRQVVFDKGEDIDVYTAYGFRLKNVVENRVRAAMFYVEYELNGQSYILLSTVDEVRVVAVAAE